VATWIGHLRVAENLLSKIPYLDQVAFTFGNLAPDSGIPNADWTQFDPPKEVTHFLRNGEGENEVHDLEFYHLHLASLAPDGDPARYAFILGYFFHLLCDRLWAQRIWVPSRHAYASLVSEHGEHQAVEMIKTDWYGLDLRYVRDHPESNFWRVFRSAPNPPQYLPFVSEVALAQQFDYIRRFYGEPDSTWILDRAYPYLNEVTMARWVADVTVSLLKIYSRLDELALLDGTPSALALLNESEIAPYSQPLGDG
jgi:hypothetical protein